MHSGRIIVFCSTLLLYIQITFAANFPECLQIIRNVSNITTNETKYFASLELTRPLLTLAGCEHFCGTGFQFWPAEDTFGRLVLWVLPVTVLIAHYHFGPLSVRGKIEVFAHLLGDPVDSLWSLLTRQEVYRRLHLRTKDYGPLETHIATLLAAYEILGWQEASDTQLMDTIAGLGNLTPVQVFFIHEASNMLVSNHSESQLGTWISTFALFAALLGAYVKTWVGNLNDQTAHTLAIVSLFFHCIALVKISGNIGAFTTTSAPLYTLLNLRWKLRKCCQQCASNEPEIFPPLAYKRWEDNRGDTENVDGQEPDPQILHSWQGMATWLGMNSLWRPSKVLLFRSPNRRKDRGSLQLLLYSLAFVVIGSYLPAFFLSYFTNNFGFGCHDLTWTLILAVWILSMAADEILKRCVNQRRRLWSWTIFKDLVVVLFMISAMLVSQIGPMNSCFCKAKMRSGENAIVDLGPFTEDQYVRGYIPWVSAPVGGFLATMLLIFVVGRGGEHGRRLLNRRHEERDSEYLALRTLQDNLKDEDFARHFSHTCDDCTSKSVPPSEITVVTEGVGGVASSEGQPDPESLENVSIGAIAAGTGASECS